ncbi:MAG: phage shock protein A [Luteibaculaceae bacterium]|jgi:phage shock protein A
MSIFRRLFKIGESEVHSAMDKLENPIKLTEQGIRDLKKDMEKSLHSLAEVKALEIRTKQDFNSHTEQAKDYEEKALILLQKAKDGKMDPSEADRLAQEALRLRETNMENASRNKEELNRFATSISSLESNIRTLKSNISKWENELKTLTARVKVSEATKNMNKQLSKLDSNTTVSMLEKMKDKVAQEEALAESYGDIARESTSLDDEINKAVASDKESASLDDFKKKMGL